MNCPADKILMKLADAFESGYSVTLRGPKLILQFIDLVLWKPIQ